MDIERQPPKVTPPGHHGRLRLAAVALLVTTLAGCGDGDDSDGGTALATTAVSVRSEPQDTSSTGATSTTTLTTAEATTTTRPATTAAPATDVPATTTATTTPAPTTGPSSTSAPASPAVAVWRGDAIDHRVALTFDAGSDCGNVGTILDILAESGIAASFGLTGRWVERCPVDAARIGREGHQLLNHSYDHPSFTGYSTGAGHLSSDEIVDQVRRAEAAIVARTGRPALPWFRAPYGDHDSAVHEALGRAGVRYDVLWTVDSLGWKGADPEAVLLTVRQGAVGGAIILMHVGAASTDHLALRRVIDQLRSDGFGFATVEDLI